MGALKSKYDTVIQLARSATAPAGGASANENAAPATPGSPEPIQGGAAGDVAEGGFDGTSPAGRAMSKLSNVRTASQDDAEAVGRCTLNQSS
jgi:hypothetical protein